MSRRLQTTVDGETPQEAFSRSETAQLLGVTTSTLTRYMRRGLIEYYQVGGRVYFTTAQLDAFWTRSRRVAWVQPELPFGEAAS
jgi:excisionase family DNA binding protein